MLGCSVAGVDAPKSNVSRVRHVICRALATAPHFPNLPKVWSKHLLKSLCVVGDIRGVMASNSGHSTMSVGFMRPFIHTQQLLVTYTLYTILIIKLTLIMMV